MKTLARLTLVLCAIAAPTLSFAQSNDAPLTRAQVHAELVQLKQVGYAPDGATYPLDIQSAEAKLAAQAQEAGGARGGALENGTSAAGAHVDRSASVKSPCVGPASACDIYFGS